MNRRFLLSALIALICLGAVAVISYWPRAGAGNGRPPLEGAQIGGSFTLVDQSGQRFTEQQLKGHYVLMYFGYTFCPDVCPTDLTRLMKGLKSFEAMSPERADKVLPVFITIDPERDTPAVVGEYVKAFHPRLIGLSGDRPAVDKAIKAYRIYAKKSDGTDPEYYMMDHSANGYLFDKSGNPMVLFSQTDTADDIAQALDRWVK